MLRVLTLCAMVLLPVACTNANDLDEAPADLGNFRLGHNVAVAPNLTKGAISREASKEEWIAAMKAAIDERFGRYEGTHLYHLGISIEGYVLAVPGVPVVVSPKSALIIRVTAWDDAAGQRLNETPELITIFESISPETLVGSGLTQTREVQIENLARNAAKMIQNWLVQENFTKGWFDDKNPVSPEADPQVTAPTAEQTPAERAMEISEIIFEPLVGPLPPVAAPDAQPDAGDVTQ